MDRGTLRSLIGPAEYAKMLSEEGVRSIRFSGLWPATRAVNDGQINDIGIE